MIITRNIIIILFIITTIFGLKASMSLASSTPPVTGDSGQSAAAGNSNNQQQAQKLVISDAWARASMSPNKNSVVYMKINNPTNDEYILIGASSIDVANNVELHKSFIDEKGVSRMTPLDKLVIPAKSEVTLDEGGIHIMLIDLKNNLEAGKKIYIDLKFEGKDPVTVEAEVRK